MPLRPGEEQLYRRTLQIAQESASIADKTTNLDTKLHRLDLAEQKLRDLLWLWPENNPENVAQYIECIQIARQETLQKWVLPDVATLLDRAEKAQGGQRRYGPLKKAGIYLGYCREHLSGVDLVRLEERLHGQGGTVVPPDKPEALSATYRRPEVRRSGCGTQLLLLPLHTLRIVLLLLMRRP